MDHFKLFRRYISSFNISSCLLPSPSLGKSLYSPTPLSNASRYPCSFTIRTVSSNTSSKARPGPPHAHSYQGISLSFQLYPQPYKYALFSNAPWDHCHHICLYILQKKTSRCFCLSSFPKSIPSFDLSIIIWNNSIILGSLPQDII